MNNYNELIAGLSTIKLDLGCGEKKIAGAIGIDYMQLDGVDVVHNLEEPFTFIADNSVDEIHSRHVLEHLNDIEGILSEIYRILKPGGKFVVTVPHFSNPYYYSDYTHKRFFGLYSFDYFATPKTQLKRKSPVYYNTLKFDVASRKMNFFSDFMIRNLFKQVFSRLVNINNYTLEFYEEMLTNFIGCNEIRTVLVKP